MNNLSDLLNQFAPISLSEMDSVSLMSRIDTKFVFRSDFLPGFLQEIKEDYKILEINGLRQSKYETLYFDTEHFQMYLKHHNKRTNRHKIRYRRYVESDLSFFEVKHKNNKKVTRKKRIKHHENISSFNEKAKEFIKKETPYHHSDLEPKLWVNYSRITLVNKTQCERLTIDLNLEFDNNVQNKGMSHFVIAELKQGEKIKTRFTELMSKYKIKPFSISKYCLGVVLLFESIKKNNFKKKLLTLNKITYGTAI